MNDQPRLEVIDGGLWPFLVRQRVREMFGHRLEKLHEWPHIGDVQGDITREQDQATRAHEQFYRLFPRLEDSYRRAAVDFGRAVLNDEPFYVQRVPSFRVHFPRSRSVGEAHIDHQYGHQFGEITFWVPLTRARHSATMWVGQHAEGWEQRKGEPVQEPGEIKMWPVNLEVGQILRWDSVLRPHGNLLNHEELTEMLELDMDGEPMEITGEEGAVLVEKLRGQPLRIRRHWWAGSGITRVSLDFRVLPARLHEPETQRCSVNAGVPMTLGSPDKPGYWTDPLEWA